LKVERREKGIVSVEPRERNNVKDWEGGTLRPTKQRQKLILRGESLHRHQRVVRGSRTQGHKKRVRPQREIRGKKKDKGTKDFAGIFCLSKRA